MPGFGPSSSTAQAKPLAHEEGKLRLAQTASALPPVSYPAGRGLWYNAGMEQSPHNNSDLPQATRDAFAAACGLPLQGQEQFYVVVLNNTDQERRDRAWAEMQRIAVMAQRNIAASGIQPEELETLVDDVCHEVRYGRPR